MNMLKGFFDIFKKVLFLESNHYKDIYEAYKVYFLKIEKNNSPFSHGKTMLGISNHFCTFLQRQKRRKILSIFIVFEKKILFGCFLPKSIVLIEFSSFSLQVPHNKWTDRWRYLYNQVRND